MTDNKSVTYVSLELPFTGLFRTQVINVLKRTAIDTSIDLKLCSFVYPWHLLSHWRFLRRLRLELCAAGIEFQVLPGLLPVKFAMTSKLYFFVLTGWLRLIVKVAVRTDIGHGRGYLASFLLLNQAHIRSVIFDMRSLWIEEHIAAGYLDVDSKVYSLWRQMEARLVDKSSASLAVNQQMKRKLEARYPTCSIDVVPIAVDLKALKYREESRRELREELGWSDSVVFVYSGSFGLHGLNFLAVGSLMRRINQSRPDAKFLFLTNEPAQRVRDLITVAGLSEECFKALSVDPSKLGDYLSAADMGLHALSIQPDSDTRLGTKVVEYWANGLPVTVTDTIGAAADVILEFGLGHVVNLNMDEEDFEALIGAVKLNARALYRPQFDRFNAQVFSVESVSKMHINTYNACKFM